MPAVGPDHKIGADLDRAVWRLRTQPDDPARLLDEIGDFIFHGQMKAGKSSARFGKEVKEIPLRHQRDELAAGRQVAEIRKLYVAVADDAVQLADFLMRAREKGLEQAALVP